MFKVALTQRIHDDGMAILRREAEVTILNLKSPKIRAEDLFDKEGLIIRIGTLDRETILASSRLKVIGRTGVGYDNIDIKTATERGIPVVITPNANTLSVAEHTIALILTLSKDVVRSDKELRKGNFDVRNSFKAFEVTGKTLGIIGFGNIGKEVARLARALGMLIGVYDPVVQDYEVRAQGYEYFPSLHPLLEVSDIITLHVPLTAYTRNMIGKRELAMIKQGALIINCARGGVVDEEALYEALVSGHLGGAGLDVFGQEPPGSHKLFSLETVVVTPHMAAQTREAASRMACMAAEGVLAILKGQRWPHVVNPEVFK